MYSDIQTRHDTGIPLNDNGEWMAHEKDTDDQTGYVKDNDN